MSDGVDEQAIRAARPSIDERDRDQTRAEIERRLFGAPSDPRRLGRFVILESLGRGGMGVVYSAYDPALDRRVALKLLRPRPGHDAEDMRARLHREAQALARLSHPNVVPVYDVGILEGEVFIVMEFVIGQTLRSWAHDRPWYEVMAMYLQAAKGLAAAHAVGLVHRDVKPDNIIVGQDGRPRVLDFGLAYDVAAGEFEADPTAASAIVGTPSYMAPEQLAGTEVGPAVDQFSFCVSLYEALYGRRPFASPARRAPGHNPAFDLVEPPATSPIPVELWATLRRGLDLDPAQRWPSMDALAEALLGQLAGFNQALTDPGVQRIPQIIFAIFAGVIALTATLVVHVKNGADGLLDLGLIPITITHTSLTMMGTALLLYTRHRWQQVKQLHHLLGTYALCGVGALIHDLVSLYAERTVYETMLAVQPMFIAVFTLASFAYARWMAWIAVIYLVGLVMALALPGYSLVWTAGGSILGWIVVLASWRRLVRKHGRAPARPAGSAAATST